MSQQWTAAARRWSEAAALLAGAGRAPADIRDWLGPAWTGPAARAFAEWANAFRHATREASAVLDDAAARAVALASDPGVGVVGLVGADRAARAVAAVPVPGQRSEPPEAPAPTLDRVPSEPERAPDSARSEPTRSEPAPEAAPSVTPTPSGGPASSGSVQSWIEQAVRILREHGYRPEQMDPEAIATIIRHESSGVPSAVNDWDSNAARGTPSMGLMQTIGPTFDRWHLPGHGEIMDPVDNIIAGVRYAVARYGSVSQAPGVLSLAAGGSYRGY